MLVLVCVLTFAPVAYAHNGVEHKTPAEAQLHDASSDEQMRTIIALLQKLIFLLEMKQEQQNGTWGSLGESIVVPTTPTNEVSEMIEHHEEHSPIVTPPVQPEPLKKLIIEIEAHHGSTHVHVRHVDKPEEMFFVAPALDDTEGIVRDVSGRTGLTPDEVRNAIVRVGM